MRPVRLKFKGINSFSEETEIDFEKLAKSGIFGIFGDTGSGKSTILDCISFALYGRVERSKEKLDIINYRSDAAEVSFEFNVLGEGVRRRYLAERSLKRKSGLHKAMLYEDGECIADNATTVTKKITEILGVDAEDFRKCIALPQGEFSQFVKSQPSERIALIERLFSLSKYGDRLKERIKQRESEAELAYQTVSAKLSLYSDVSEQTVGEVRSRIAETSRQIERLSVESAEAEREYESIKSLGEKYAQLLDTDKKLGELKRSKPLIDRLKSGLKAAPFCKTAVECDKSIAEKTQTAAELARQLNGLIARINEVNSSISALSVRMEEGKFDETIERCITLAAKYSSAEGKGEKLSLLEKHLAVKRGQFRGAEAKLAQLRLAQDEAQKAVTEAETRLSDAGLQNLKDLIYVDFRGAFLKEEYVSSLDYFAGLKGQLNFFKDDSELYSFISDDIKRRTDDYKERVLHVKDFSLERADGRLAAYEEAYSGREKLIDCLNAKKSALKDAETAVNDCLRDMQTIRDEGNRLRLQSDEIRAELVKIYGAECRDYAAAERENNDKLSRVRAEKRELSSKLESSNKQLSELISARAETEAKINSLTSETQSLREKLRVAVEESGLGSYEACKALAAEFSGISDVESTVEEYGAQLKSLTMLRGELSATAGIDGFSQEKLTAANERRTAAANSLAGSREALAVLESDRRKAEARLSEKNGLTTEFTQAESRRNLIAGLKEVTKGNKFIEFIANEYLYDISSLASSTLLTLTDGRYFLTYTDTFYVGDNFDCGNLRGVNTLSGGETFLVSLSLALALSRTICASLKSIEFFFLDEGFGTLDGALVDTVMNALEKLKSSNFTIGVISHVEELKHRIDSKITVYKATETRGSYVQLSC